MLRTRVHGSFMQKSNDERERYAAAKEYAAKKHAGQFRAGGEPYITHPIAVAQYLKEKGYGEVYVLTALFHDLLEDTNAAEAEIAALGGETVLEAVKLLTKREGLSMDEYVRNIRKNPVAFAVKGADRLHNLKSAFFCDESFRKRYIEESLKYYSDFNPEIPAAIEELKKSLGGKA